MLTLIDRLIARHVLYSMLLVLSVLVALAVFFILIDGLKDYGKANFGVVELIKYIILKQPRQVYQLSPIAALIGTVMGLSTLALNSELTAMRAAGVSVTRIVVSTLKIGFVFAAAMFLVGEYVVPVSENLAQSGRAKALATALKQKGTGVWLRSGTSFVNIGEVLPDLSLLRMNIYDFDGMRPCGPPSGQPAAGQIGSRPLCDNHLRLRMQTSAKRAWHDGDRWWLEEVRQSLILGKEAVEVRRSAKEDWLSAITPEVVSVFAVRPESLSIRQLRYYIGHLQQNSQDTRNFRLVFWQKIFMPLATLVMALLATPFVFRPIRSGGLSHRVFIGIMLGLVFIILNQSLGYFGVLYALAPLAGALLPIAIFFVLALVLLHRAARGRGAR